MNWETDVHVETVLRAGMCTVRVVHGPTGLWAEVTAQYKWEARSKAEQALWAQIRPLTVDPAANAILDFVRYAEEHGDNVWWIEDLAVDFLETRQQRIREALTRKQGET